MLFLLNIYIGVSFAEKAITDSGPTIYLDYSSGLSKKTPIYDFMYFVPTVSPTLVDTVSSPDNTQQTEIISYKKYIENDSFRATIEFEIAGKGFYKNTYDPEEIIALNLKNIPQGKTLKNMLDYIIFHGAGYVTVEIKGIRSGPVELVTEVAVNFNARDHESPVTIGIYDVEPVNGKYKYENRYNNVVACVDSLTFQRTASPSKMQVKLAAMYDFGDSEDLWAIIKGKVVNFFIPPIRIDDDGNKVMLDFALALYKQRTEFTFPKAKHLKIENDCRTEKNDFDDRVTSD
jgi:hypothetical protein